MAINDDMLARHGDKWRERVKRQNAVMQNKMATQRTITAASMPKPQGAAMLRTMIKMGETEIENQPVHAHRSLSYFHATVTKAAINDGVISGVIKLKALSRGPFLYRVVFCEREGFWNVVLE